MIGQRQRVRLERLPEIPPEPVLPRAEYRLSHNARLRAHVTEIPLAGGVTDQPLMLTLSVGF